MVKKIKDENLNASGGKVVKLADGKFTVIPNNSLTFDTESEAKASEKTLRNVGFWGYDET